jgi:hypothetical protein
MKLRLKGNSIRLRITPSEMARLLETGRVEESVHFPTPAGAALTYALEHAPIVPDVAVRSMPQEIAVIVSSDEARRWAGASDVGIYAQIPTPAGPLDVAVEKDFACLDGNDAENEDTFPNPLEGSVC